MTRLWRSVGAVFLGAAAIVGCTSTSATSGQGGTTVPRGTGSVTAGTAAAGTGKIKVVYDEANVKPENLEAFRIVKQSGALDRLTAFVNDRLALPRDISVKVTDAVPKGVTDASFDVIDGSTVWEPAFFLTETYEAAKAAVPKVKAAGKVPSVFTDAEFTPENVLIGATEFIYGHELGHTLSLVTDTPTLTFEEYQADGFAAFATLNDPSIGYKPAIHAAVFFDELAEAHGETTVSDLASDHPVIQARIYNFLCLAAGSDMAKLQKPLIDSGLVPQGRSPFCGMQWAQLDHGWWRVLEPAMSPSGLTLTADARQKAKANYERAQAQFKDEIVKIREQGG